MIKLTRFLTAKPWLVLLAWVGVVAALVLSANTVGEDYRFDAEIGGSESLAGIELLLDHSTEGSNGDQIRLVWGSGDINADKPAVEELLEEISQLEGVAGVISPWDGQGQISANEQVAYANIILQQDALTVPTENVVAIIEVVEEAEIEYGLSGQSIEQADVPEQGESELFGLIFAAFVLVAAFGSVIAASLPLMGALVALGASLSVVTLMSNAIAIPSFAPQLVALLGIGVGIDYVLFIVSRHRSGLRRGLSVKESLEAAMDSSGRAVLFAGVTVCVAILGLLIAGIGFLNGLAYATTVGVVFTMVVAVTLTPALLTLLGTRVLSKKARAKIGTPVDEGSLWGAWARMVQRRPWVWVITGTTLLLLMAIPALDMRLGTADASTRSDGNTQRVAYDLLAEGFGVGFNGPVLLISENVDPGEALNAELASNENVAFVSPTQLSDDGEIYTVSVLPTGGPQEESTSELVMQLREAASQVDGEIYVSGYSAVFYDFSKDLQSKIGWFLIGVLGLSSLLLMVAFRSILIPIKAAAMNLLAAGATFGVLTLVFQKGWGAELLGIETLGPVDSFLPVMLLAILFGLSMDYQVFLVSRMKEEWSKTGDNETSVRVGLEQTGRVITAAALIMCFVFGSFLLSDDRIIKMFGLGLAVAVFLDAFVIRSLLVPALMQLLGPANWWMPKWLSKITPRVDIEPKGQVGENQGESTPVSPQSRGSYRT